MQNHLRDIEGATLFEVFFEKKEQTDYDIKFSGGKYLCLD